MDITCFECFYSMVAGHCCTSWFAYISRFVRNQLCCLAYSSCVILLSWFNLTVICFLRSSAEQVSWFAAERRSIYNASNSFFCSWIHISDQKMPQVMFSTLLNMLCILLNTDILSAGCSCRYWKLKPKKIIPRINSMVFIRNLFFLYINFSFILNSLELVSICVDISIVWR